MDFATRKYLFIKSIVELTDESKLEELEKVLFSQFDNEDSVILDLSGESISQEEYIKRNNEAVRSHLEGKSFTIDELKRKYKSK